MRHLEEHLHLKPIFAGIQKFTTLDDEGFISVVLFTRGCNLRCHYCHNPELVVAPFSHFLPSYEVKDFLLKRRGILHSVVITGGEPTLWGEDLYHWIEYIKCLGYRVKFDTNGLNPEMLQLLIENNLVDKVAIDFKAPFRKYFQVTAVKCDVEKIKKSFSLLCNSSIDYEIRSTIHSSLHSKEDIEMMIFELSSLGVENYYLQAFKMPTKTVGTISSKSHFDYEYFENLLSKFFVNSGIRNI